MKLPDELIQSPNWICWKGKTKKGHQTKIPIAPWVGHKNAVSVTDPKNYTTYEKAQLAAKELGVDGIGFVFTKDNPFIGVDFDNCLKEGNIQKDIGDIIKKLNSYSEISPSGMGVHTIVKGTITDSLKEENNGLEIYPQDRYFTITGQHLQQTPFSINDAQNVLEELLKKHGKHDEIDIEELLKKAPGIGEHSDYKALYLATWCRRNGLSNNEATEILIEWWRTSPNYKTDGDAARWIRSKIDSAYRGPEPYSYWFKQDPRIHQIENGKIKRIGENQQWIDKTKKEAKPEGGVYKEGESKRKITKDDWWIISFDKDGNKKIKINTGWLSEEVMANHLSCATIDVTQELLIFKEGVYIAGETVVAETTQRLITPSLVKTNHINEVIGYIKRATYTPLEEFDKELNIVNIKNGLLDIQEKKLTKHKKRILCQVQLPINYDEKAECPNIMKFLSEIISENDAQLIQELIGYCLYRKHHIQKSFMFLGRGANGKSTFLDLLKEFLGKENTASVGLQELSENRFAPAQLYSKLANIHADLPGRKILDSGVFKMVTGGDLIFAEKKFQDPFNFVSYAKQIFSANNLPAVDDDTEAFFRRWIIINFPNKFEGDDADPTIIKKLTTEEELSGFLNWALEGLHRLLENGKFSDGKTTEEIREDYIRKSDPVAAFVMDNLEVDSEGEISKDDLYQMYVKYCKENKLPIVTKICFSRDHLPKHISNLRVVRRGKRGDQYYAWQGIKLKFEEKIARSIDQKIDLNYEPTSGSKGSIDKSPFINRGRKTFLERSEENKSIGSEDQRENKISNKDIMRTPATITTPKIPSTEKIKELFLDQYNRNKLILKIINDLTTDSRPVHFEDICDRTEIKGISIEETKIGMEQLKDANHIFSPKKDYWFAITKLADYVGG